MNNKVMYVYYGPDRLPYKDKELSIHYPICGNSFVGASLTDEIRFYVDDIGGTNDIVWIANTKRPDGQVGYEILSVKTDLDTNEKYLSLKLGGWYCEKKGDIYISLNGFDEGADVSIDEDTGIYSVSGNPIIQATGSIKIAINYATQMNNGYGSVPEISVQEALALVSARLEKSSPFYIKVVDDKDNINTSTYKNYLNSGDVIFSKGDKTFYVLSGTYPSLVATEIELDVNSIRATAIYATDVDVNATFNIVSFYNMSSTEEGSLDSFIQALVDDNGNVKKSVKQYEIGTSQDVNTFLNDNNLYEKVFVLAYKETPSSPIYKTYICYFNGISYELEEMCSTNRYSGSFIKNHTTKVFGDLIIVDRKHPYQLELVSGSNIKTINNQSILGSGNLDIAGGGNAEWGQITGTLSDQTDLNNELQNIREVAEGKTNTVILDYSEEAPTESTFSQKPYYDFVGNRIVTWADFVDFVGNRTYANGKFNSQNDTVSIVNTEYIIFTLDGHNVVYRGDEAYQVDYAYDCLSEGDNIYIIQVDVPDRWVRMSDQELTCQKLETSKVDLSDYATNADLAYGLIDINKNIAPTYVNTYTYDVGDFVIHDFKLYRCITAITTAESWDSTHWALASVGNDFVSLDKAQTISGAKTFTGEGNTFQKWMAVAEIRPASGTYISIRSSLRSAGGAKDIGTSTYPFGTLYLSGNLTDGTNSVSVAQLSGVCGSYSTNSTTQLEYSYINNISISADATFTLATAPSDTYPEYKANITNSGASDITITLPSGTSIKGNLSITSNTFVIPSGSSVELNIQNDRAIVVEW